uniref:Aspartate/glutamate/uridylate kinase domain-containing protein n=1 Tax=Sexangularia sp. CB-2014 TaxID=1486929 RepID=A0A7S1V531_9EUKA|mmetsp:Transcript_11856/g.37670  ORF Transcript_11856/g.37670 Transcript_11856/m.37670 type:complete len:541 (+) Transcript_11856:84-1706(+)
MLRIGRLFTGRTTNMVLRSVSQKPASSFVVRSFSDMPDLNVTPIERTQHYGGVSVMKFGGSSLGSASAFRKVRSIIKDEQDKHGAAAIVVSAMYGVTDQLVAAGNAAAAGDAETVENIYHEVRNLHLDTADVLFKFDVIENDSFADFREATRSEVPSDVEIAMSMRPVVSRQLDALLDAGFLQVTQQCLESGELAPSDRDLLHSLGERLSSTMAYFYLISCGFRAKIVDPSTCIVTEGKFGEGRPNLAESEHRLRRELVPLFNAKSVAIVPGFFGGDSNGVLHTFGRGGSDLTAAVVGHAVDANMVTLWKVEHEKEPDSWRMREWRDGLVGIVHSVEASEASPPPLDEVSYGTAGVMAKFGKKVLHPDTVFPLIEKNIPVRVANTIRPDEPGTFIRQLENRYPFRPTSVVTVPMSQLDHAEVVWDTDGQRRDFIVEASEVPEESVLVVLVGLNLNEFEVKVAEYMFTAPLRAAKIDFVVPSTVKMTSVDPSSFFCLAVPKDSAKEAAKLLHRAFVKPHRKKVVDEIEATDDIAHGQVQSS